MKNLVKYGDGVLLILAGLLTTQLKVIGHNQGFGIYVNTFNDNMTNTVLVNGSLLKEYTFIVIFIGLVLILSGTIRIIKERFYETK
jgi:hypothetical protein